MHCGYILWALTCMINRDTVCLITNEHTICFTHSCVTRIPWRIFHCNSMSLLVKQQRHLTKRGESEGKVTTTKKNVKSTPVRFSFLHHSGPFTATPGLTAYTFKTVREQNNCVRKLWWKKPSPTYRPITISRTTATWTSIHCPIKYYMTQEPGSSYRYFYQRYSKGVRIPFKMELLALNQH